MFRNLLVFLIILCFVTSTVHASYYEETQSNGGNVLTHLSAHQRSLDGVYRGAFLDGSDNEQGVTHTTLTLGRSAIDTSTTIDPSYGNSYQQQGEVQTLGALSSFTNVGITDLKDNNPSSICDAAGNLALTENNSTTSRYPSEQRVESIYGAMGNNLDGTGVTLSETTAALDDTLANDMKLNGQGSLYRDFRATTIKGYNKSDTSYGYTNDIHSNTLLQSNTSTSSNAHLLTVYNGFGDAMNGILESNQTVNGYASNETAEDVVNQSVNSTKVKES